MENYEIHFDICAFILYITSLIVYFSKKDTRKLQNKIFSLVLLNGLIASIADITSSVLMATGNPKFYFAVDVANYVYLIVHNALPPTFSFYVMVLIGVSKKFTRTIYTLFFAPFAVSLIGLFLNPITHAVFYYDAHHVYTHSWFFFYLYGICVVYFFAVIFAVIKFNYSISIKKAFFLIVFIVVDFASVVFQFFFPKILLELFAQAVTCLSILMTIENGEEVLNPITGLYNRRAFILENISLLETKQTYSIIIVKLLNQRYYLSTLGYRFAQELNSQVAQYFVEITNQNYVYDLDNGIFAIVLDGDAQKKCHEISDRIYEKFSQDWLFRDMSISFETQICVILVPQDIHTLENLLMLADTTDVKIENRVTIVQEEQLKYMQRRAAIENAIEKALRNNSFQVYYQPIWDCKANKIHSAEALVRLIDDEMGFISPEEFIPIAEKNGTITSIGQFVFEDACHLFTKEHLDDIGIDFIEVNLSTVQCMHKNLPQILKNTLEHYSLSSRTINLEITESAAIHHQDTFQQTMQELRNLNFTFSLDDYGTGYSNASYIFNMDFSIIKIDKSILWEADKKAFAKIILQNTVRMIKEMNLKIVVEGVETEQQKNLVASLGCDYCQGYYFSKPLPKAEFTEYCRNFNSRLKFS